ncbi:MAG: type transport system ATP-binding protein [Pseudonocardiales bacterium]|jgi:ABC-2 type transport system ATP-binding protein|nr:type transport system ATP-binding protein [Pseudonocardiales bacterium]
MIRTEGLTKRFRSVSAVSGLDLDVRAHDIYGFLGANGSGKTTTVRMLLGLVLATSGSIEVLGHQMPKAASTVLPRVGALVEGPAFYGHLSGQANLAIFDASGPAGSRRTRSARIHEMLDTVGLSEIGRRPVKAYSLGMRQRLGLAAALVRAPELLILDEPTNGLDPQGIHEIRQLLLELNRLGTTIFLSSHLLAEVEQLCTRVGVIDRGRLVVQDSLANLQAPTGRTMLSTPEVATAMAILNGRVVSSDGPRLIVQGADPAELNALLVGHGVRVDELGPERRSLEQVVLELTAARSDHTERP